MTGIGISERAPWGDFPTVIRNGDLKALSNEPEYTAAKQGDVSAALNLVDRLLSDETVEKIRAAIGDDKPVIVPVLAEEASGNNKIPLAMAEAIAERLGLDVELNIVQREKVMRTGAGSDHRLAFTPTFDGDVKKGESYLIVDDTLSMGGTIASLRGYIENRGGKVVGASVMTAHPGALDLPVKQTMLAAIESRHGSAMNDFWKETFGYGIEQLTQGEAGHLRAAQSVDALRTRITEARHEGIKRMDEAGAKAQTGTEKTLTSADQDLVTAQSLQREQQSAVEATPIEKTYQSTLAMYTEAKRAQVERIESKLSNLIDQQEGRLQQIQRSAPGLLSLPSTKRAWNESQQKARARIQSLNDRLDGVRDLKESMGVHGPKLEELAARKLKADKPDLVSEWNNAQAVARRSEILQKRLAAVREQKEGKVRGHSVGLSQNKS